ncbi:MAG: hypothetical protein WCO60_06015 [Verrucomicrobiota bacterium]
MTKNTVAQFCAIAAVVALPTLSFAGTPAKKCCAPAPEKLAESAITGDIGVNVVSAYYSRGVVNVDHSASFQPYLDLNFKAYQGDGFINKAVVGLGLWNSFSDTGSHKKPVVAGSSTTNTWYESDFLPSIALTSGKFTLTETFLIDTYPGDTAKTALGLQSKLAFDDSDLLGAFALHPAFTHVAEFEGKVGNGGPVGNTPGRAAGTNQKEGNYWELSIAPGTAVGPINVTLPMALAFGTNGFYNKNGYGYFSAGLNLAYTLPVSKSYGTWTANTGVTYYNTANGLNNATQTPQNDVVVSAGLGLAF